MRTTKAQTSLRKCAASSEPSLVAHTAFRKTNVTVPSQRHQPSTESRKAARVFIFSESLNIYNEKAMSLSKLFNEFLVANIRYSLRCNKAQAVWVMRFVFNAGHI